MALCQSPKYVEYTNDCKNNKTSTDSEQKIQSRLISEFSTQMNFLFTYWPVPVVARSKVLVCSCSLAGIVGSNPTGGMDVLSVVSVVCCCQVEVSVTSWPLVQRSPSDCGASLCVI